MSKTCIYIDVHSYRTRVAVTVDGELSEFFIEKNNKAKTVGSIYRGKVVNVLSGMNAAFVNIGLEKNAYLYVGGGLIDKSALIDQPTEETALKVEIGDEIMVQVAKDQSGTKGARITQDVSVAGRFLVYMPNVDYVGISRKIEDEPSREKLYKTVKALAPVGGGFVVRTAAATASNKELKQDAKFLIETFNGVKKSYESSSAPKCVYIDGDIVFRTIRDLYSASVDTIMVNDSLCFEYVSQILGKMCPRHKTEIILYSGGGDMFYEYQLNGKVESLLQKKVTLKNGAYLVIDKTEALTAIDVNTGKYVGSTEHLEETVFITNMLAAREIARQIRLRNLGGIIIADFIDMATEEHKQAVISELEAELKKDRIKSSLVDMTSLGLVEITRKKARNDISAMLMRACPYCNGNGMVYSYEYMMMRIRIALLETFKRGGDSCLITVNPDVSQQVFKMKMLSEDIETIWSDKRIYIVASDSVTAADFKVESLLGEVLSLPNEARLLY